MVSDEGHDYALEVVMRKDAAQSFSFLFTGAGMKMDYSKPSLCLAVPFVRFLQSHSLLDVFINCAPFPWVLVINCNDKWKYSKINLFSRPSAKSTLRTSAELTIWKEVGKHKIYMGAAVPWCSLMLQLFR